MREEWKNQAREENPTDEKEKTGVEDVESRQSDVAAEKNGKHGANVGRESGAESFEIAEEEPEEEENDETYGDREKVLQPTTESRPERRVFRATAIGEIVESPGVKHEHSADQNKGKNKIKNEMEVVGDGNEEPGGCEAEEKRVREELDEPKAAAAKAIRKGSASDIEARHYFTSTTAASVVAMMDGWYMG